MGIRASKKSQKGEFDWTSTVESVNCLDIVGHKWEWENLCIEGGGVKGVAFGGALRVLELAGALCQVRRYVGSSAGAIIATALALGYSANEITDIMLNSDFRKFKDGSEYRTLPASLALADLIGNYGMNCGVYFYEWAGKLVRKKTGNRDTTFFELQKQFHRELVITACNVNTGETVYFDYHSHPDLPIRLAVRMSMSIPFVFYPIRYGNEYYVDGGLFDNYPLDYFDERSGNSRKPNALTLGLKLMSNTETPDRRLHHDAFQCDTLIDFASALVTHTLNEVERNKIELTDDFWSRSILINTDTVKATDFDITLERRCELIRAGCTAAIGYLRDCVSRASGKSSRRGSNSGHHTRHSSGGDVPGIIDIPDSLPKAGSVAHRVRRIFSSDKPSRDDIDKLKRGHDIWLLSVGSQRDALLISRHRGVDSIINFDFDIASPTSDRSPRSERSPSIASKMSVVLEQVLDEKEENQPLACTPSH